MKPNLAVVEPETPNAAPTPRHDAHARLIAYRKDVLAPAQQRLTEVHEAAAAVNVEVQQHEAALATARQHLDAAVAAGDREAFRAARADVEFDERQLALARERATLAQAAYARAAAEFNNGPVVEVKNLLASVLMSEAPRIVAELDAALHEQVAPRLRLLGAIEAWFIREKIPGAGMEILINMRRQSERFMAAVNNSAPGATAEAELAALIASFHKT